TEVLLRSYEEWGIDCVKKFYGMFAFAIWENKLKRLILARDRVGTKPLFYTYRENIVSFASQIQSLLTVSHISRELDWQALDTYLSLGYIPSPSSGFVDIKKLPPGHVAIFDNAKQFNLYSYWSLSYTPK
ncbi:MAG: asparagine synthetase B, partial [Dolichospermum sp.]